MKRLSAIILFLILVLSAPVGATPFPMAETCVTARFFTEPGASGDVLERAIQLGGTTKVHLPHHDYLAVEIPASAVGTLANMASVISCSSSGQPVTGNARVLGRTVDRYDPIVQHNNLSAVKIPELRAQTGSMGGGVTIAVIDTGTDVSHPDLRFAPKGQRKIVDWKDFSGEGLVDTRRVATAKDGSINTVYGRINLGSISSKSGRYRYGLFREDQIDPYSSIGQDLDGNGSRRDTYAVVVVDSLQAGVYDAVYVDTNGNLDLADEVALRAYSISGGYAFFGPKDDPGSLSFVVADVLADGSQVVLGFDGNGHGTHVSGLLVAGGTRMSGAAPGANLMSLKALSSSGDGSWEDIAEAMAYAAEKGAQIISVSAGGVVSDAQADSPESLLMEELGRKYGVVFAIASGNDGPGLGTSSTPGHPDYAVTVGAYLAPSMWKSIYGHSVSGEGIWIFSAPGPRGDGSLAPDILAPGSAISTVPTYLSTSGYAIMEGTSMAVPYVAGTLALLKDAAHRQALRPDASAYKRALCLGGRPLTGVPPVEQGYGIINAVDAWEHLKALGPISVVRSLVFDQGYLREGGLFYTAPEPAHVNLYLDSFTPWPLRLVLSPTESWMSTSRPAVSLPPVRERILGVDYQVPRDPGLYSGFIVGDDPSTHGHDLAVLNTVLVPYVLSQDNSWSVALSDALTAARFRRHYFEVPPGADEVTFSLRVIKGARSEPLGRARFHIYQPGSHEVAYSSYVGKGLDCPGERVDETLVNPEPGIWEVVVESDPALSHYGRGDTYYQLRVKASGVFFHEPAITQWVSAASEEVIELEVNVTNATEEPLTGKVVGIGFSDEDLFQKSEVLSITEKEAVMRQLPDVGEGTRWFKVWAKNPTLSCNLDLYLYRYDTIKKQWVEVTSSASRDNSTEVIDIIDPEPGSYVAYVEAYGLMGSSASFEFGYASLKDDGSIMVEDVSTTRKDEETWVVRAKIKAPSHSGTFYGNILFQKGDSYSGRLPVVIHVGVPEADISVRPEMLRGHMKNQVTVRVTDPKTGQPTGRAVEINGRLYHLASGQVVIPVTAEDTEVELVIRLVDPDWASVPRTFRLKVDEGAMSPGPPNESLHQKILYQAEESVERTLGSSVE